MPARRRATSLFGAAVLLASGSALAQGHGTPNAPEAGPASPGAESTTDRNAGASAPGTEPGRESRPRPADGTKDGKTEDPPKR